MNVFKELITSTVKELEGLSIFQASNTMEYMAELSKLKVEHNDVIQIDDEFYIKKSDFPVFIKIVQNVMEKHKSNILNERYLHDAILYMLVLTDFDKNMDFDAVFNGLGISEKVYLNNSYILYVLYSALWDYATSF